MNALPTPETVLPLRPLPKPEPRFAPRAQAGSPYQLAGAEPPAADDDANDWIVVQRYDVPASSVPSCSDTAAAGAQPHGELAKTNKACSVGLGGGAKEREPPATRRSVGGGDSHDLRLSLGPWAPVNAGSYDSDVLGIGVWATDVAVGQTYAECLADL